MDTSRRDFIKSATLAAGTFLLSGSCTSVARNDKRRGKRPNLVYVFADQWRAQDAGFAGNNDVITENIDKLANSFPLLTRLTFGNNFDQNMDKLINSFPMLTHLTFGCEFNQNIDTSS